MSEKLPVLYVPESATENPGSGRAWRLVRYHLRAIETQQGGHAGLVAYEPAVTRCKTCQSWGERDGECRCWHAFGLDKAPSDGSGYCHLTRRRGDDRAL